MVSFGLLWRTIRHLRPRQIGGQLRHRLRDRLRDPARFFAGDAGATPVVRRFRVPPLASLPGDNTREGLAHGSFRFVGESAGLGWPPDWQPAGRSKLWRYNLHYFDWIWLLEPAAAQLAVNDWIESYRPGRGRDGWEAYPVSLRTLNWISYFHGHHPEELTARPEFAARLWASLHEQLTWLAVRLEHHLGANHLFENAAALAYAGAAFDNPAAGGWLRQGLRLLKAEITEQLPADGLHFERSPMYHLRILHLLLLLASVRHRELRALVEPAAARGLDALTQVLHPDGGIALLNDAALGVYPGAESLTAAARELELPLPQPGAGPFALEDAGYFGFRRGGDYVICDAGRVGPDYMPGHAHGDIFSFEMSVAGHRVVVDAGVHDYLDGELRAYCRSTRAHNTVEIEGRDQCEFWGAFRVGRRGRPHDVRWHPAADGFELEGWHDGYRHLPGRPVHRRRFRRHATGTFEVVDRVTARREVHVQSRIHLDPACTILELTADRARIRHPGGELAVAFQGGGRLTREPSIYCPRFGEQQHGTTLVYSAHGRRIDFGYRIAG